MTLKLKLGQRAPEGSAILAHVAAPKLSVSDNLILSNLSQLVDANNTGAYRTYQTVVDDVDFLTDVDVVMASKSFVDIKVLEPIPLPYSWQIGSNTELGREEWLVYDEGAKAEPINEKAAKIIKNNLYVIDQLGDPAEFYFEIEILARVAVGTKVGFRCKMYCNTQGDGNNWYRVRYNTLIQSSGDVLYNMVEAINAEPYIDFDIIEAGETPSLPIYLELDTDNSIKAKGTLPDADGIALFSDRANVIYRITEPAPGDRDLEIMVGTTSYPFPDVEVMPIRAIVDMINYNEVPVSATILADYPDGSKLPITPWTSIKEKGTIISLEDTVTIYYEKRQRIFTDIPSAHYGPTHFWFPKVDPGQIKMAVGTDDQAYYKVLEFYTQVQSTLYPGYTDAVDIDPIPVSPKQVKARHRNISMESVRLQINNAISNDQIVDYDKINGVLYLGRDLPEASISLDYAYIQDKFIYSEVDLNPTSTHNPEIPAKFVLLVIRPWKIERSEEIVTIDPMTGLPVYTPVTTTETYDKTIYHYIGDTLDEVLEEAAYEAKTVDGKNLYAFPLGVFQVAQRSDISQVKLLDVRTHGGGVLEPHADQPESEFYMDHGFIDGEPYPGAGVVVFRVPSSVQDEVIRTVDNPDFVQDQRYLDPGNMTPNNIKEVMKKHVAAGTLPLIDFYEE